ASPRDTFATTTMTASCGNMNLRADPSTTNSPIATLPGGSQVGVETSVVGGSWTVSCPSGTVSGNTWYQISQVNGQAVAPIYGVQFVYGATGLFEPVAVPTPSPTPDPFATPTPTPDPFATPTPLPTPIPTPVPTPLAPVMEGIDVSHWQNAIDWYQVAAAGKR